MKAILLAGGEGSRLRPLSLGRPKPMLPLFDRPLLEHSVELLRRSGFTQLCITLRYLSRSVMDWFGDGRDFGVEIQYQLEQEPVGTAGCVRRCADFVGDEDVLILSGDAVCDLKLAAFYQQHRLSGADASILVQERHNTRELGLVLSDGNERITGFLEKPGIENCCTDRVNTGIYVLSPAVLQEIPADRPCDFGGELFPHLLRTRRHLHAVSDNGYWNDVGTAAAYLQTCRDVLDGRVHLPLLEHTAPTGTTWISPQAEVSSQAILEAYTVIGAGSRVGPDCRLVDSVLLGSILEADCTVQNSVLDRGVRLGSGCIAADSVLGEGVTAGTGCLFRPGTVLWPGKRIPDGCQVSGAAGSREEIWQPCFDEVGRLTAPAETHITQSWLYRMGTRRGLGLRVAAAHSEDPLAAALCQAFLAGAAAAGKRAYYLDTRNSAAAAALGGLYRFDLTLFVSLSGRQATLCAFDENGLPAPRSLRRILSETGPEDTSHRACGSVTRLTGTEETYLALVCKNAGSLAGLPVAVPGGGLLARALEQLGAVLLPPEQGLPELRLVENGFRAALLDERGRSWGHHNLLCAHAALELADGCRCVCLPYDAPDAAEAIAETHNGTIYRLERDGNDALELLGKKPACRDGVFLLTRLLYRLHRREQTWSALLDSLPNFHLEERTIIPQLTPATALRRLQTRCGGETVSGLRFRQETGTATIRPDGLGRLRILVESARAETAAELCATLQRELAQP